MRAALLSALFALSLATHAPVLLWGSGTRGDAAVADFSRDSLLARLRRWRDEAPEAAAAAAAPRTITLFLLDEVRRGSALRRMARARGARVRAPPPPPPPRRAAATAAAAALPSSFASLAQLHSDELTALSTSSEPAAAAALAALSATVRGGVVAPRVPLHGGAAAPLRAALAAELAPACGALVEVGSGAGATLTREEYAVRVRAACAARARAAAAAAATAASPAPRATQAVLSAAPVAGAACVAYLVPLRHSELVSELAAVSRFSAAAAAAGGAHAFVLTAEAAPLPAYAAADDAAEAAAVRRARQLQAAGSYTAVGNIRMNPEILVGLVIGLFLAFVLIVGVQCTMAVKTPDVMHSFVLPAGREY